MTAMRGGGQGFGMKIVLFASVLLGAAPALDVRYHRDLAGTRRVVEVRQGY